MGHSQGQINFASNGDNDSSIELGLDDIDGWNTDTEVEEYLSNHSAADEYSDAGRAGGFDVL